MTDPADDPTLPEAFFLPRADGTFDSTPATASPWDLSMQHGGPPAALLARAVERCRPDADMPIARLTVDMLGPIPQGRVTTEATIVRPGRRIEMVTARLLVDGTPAVTATAWRIRRTARATAAQATLDAAPDLPGPQPQRFFAGIDPHWGYGRAIEWRFTRGSFDGVGEAAVWVRPRIPLVAGEQPSAVQRLALIADSANGVAAALPFAEWMFIPPTMTLTLAREPVGVWLNMAARTTIADSGTGLTHGRLHDADGMVGTVDQPLLVVRR